MQKCSIRSKFYTRHKPKEWKIRRQGLVNSMMLWLCLFRASWHDTWSTLCCRRVTYRACSLLYLMSMSRRRIIRRAGHLLCRLSAPHLLIWSRWNSRWDFFSLLSLSPSHRTGRDERWVCCSFVSSLILFRWSLANEPFEIMKFVSFY